MSVDNSTAGREALSSRVRQLRLPEGGTSILDQRMPWMICIVCAAFTLYQWIRVAPPATRAAASGSIATADASRSPAETSSTAKSATGAPTANSSANAATAAPGAQRDIVLESKGYIIPERQILVSPQVSGRVLELNFREGSRVQTGDVLAVLESTEYRADFERTSAMLAASEERLEELRHGSRPDEVRQSQAELDEARVNFEQAKRTYERNLGLSQKKILNEQTLEDSRFQLDSQQKRVARLEAMLQLMIDGPRGERIRAAEADVRQSRAELTRSKWRLDNCIIRAPISGTILKKNAELGNLVNPVAFNGSFSLCDMADLSRLEIDLTIQERDIAKVFEGQRCKVRAEAFFDRVYDGVVARLMPIADRAKGALPVRVRVIVPSDEEGKFLKPEMSAVVTFFKDAAPTTEAPAQPDVPAADAPSSTSAPTESSIARPADSNAK